MSRPSLVFVLAEDKSHQIFVRNCLYSLGYTTHDVRVADLPAGKGSGEHFVNQHYLKAVKTFRQRVMSRKANTGLVVVVDADTTTLEYRRRQFRRRLREADEAPIGANEQIVHLIPKRHIETWILFLSGNHVDEDTDCKRLHHNKLGRLVKPAAETLGGWSKNPHRRPPNCLPSLDEAFPELARLDID